jgi:hypothetical protein
MLVAMRGRDAIDSEWAGRGIDEPRQYQRNDVLTHVASVMGGLDPAIYVGELLKTWPGQAVTRLSPRPAFGNQGPRPKGASP